MNVLFILLLVVCIFYFAISRPLRMNELERETNELESEDNMEIAVDESNNEDSNIFLKQRPASQEESERSQGELSGNSYQETNEDGETPLESDANLFSDYKPIDNRNSKADKFSEALNSNEKMKTSSNCWQSNKYTEKNDFNHQLEPLQRFTNSDVKIYKANRMRNLHNKRTIHTPVEEDIQVKKIYNHDKHRGNNKGFQQGLFCRRYDNILNKNTQNGYENERNIRNRDRRNVPEIKQDSEELADSKNQNEYFLESGNVDEELAIKKHIQRLSDIELEELLNSLTEEKRALLKKIIDEDNVNNAMHESINKREITKKAGAVEDNNLIESIQSDTNKLQGSSPVGMKTESSGSDNTDTTKHTTKQTVNFEKVDESTSKSSETNCSSENKSELTSHSNETNQVMLDNNLNSWVSSMDVKNKPEVALNQETGEKSETKRETNMDDIENFDTALDDIKISEYYYNDNNAHDMSLAEDYNIYPQDENISQMIEDEVQGHNEKSYKRELTKKQSEVFDSIKALEESFPNSKVFGESSSNSGPLIRVKRTDSLKHNMTKRLAEIVPDTRIGYYPHRMENVDEDYEEGSEFDDDGFYDRTSNFKTENDVRDPESHNNLKSETINTIRSLKSNSINKVSNNNNKKENAELGSDTDNILSGVEGVDENLMFSSNSGNRGSLDLNFNSNAEDT